MLNFNSHTDSWYKAKKPQVAKPSKQGYGILKNIGIGIIIVGLFMVAAHWDYQYQKTVWLQQQNINR